MTEESTLSEDGLAKRIADFAASFAANQKALADLAPIANPNMVAMLAEAALSDRGDGFACYVAENMVAIRASALRSEEVCTVLVMGYELGISVGSAACMNDLGALYYMGELVPRDYARAAKLYEQAMDHGCFQSIINLGYIYEYGRTGEADHQKAYQCYALASALQPSCEAVYKLGDMYSRGEAVPSSMGKACQLWERSLELAGSVVEAAQPSVRIAKAIQPLMRRVGRRIRPPPCAVFVSAGRNRVAYRYLQGGNLLSQASYRSDRRSRFGSPAYCGKSYCRGYGLS